MVWIVLGVGILLFIIGQMMKSSATPKKDKRFKTGYEDNATVDKSLKDRGEYIQGFGSILIIGVVIYFFI